MKIIKLKNLIFITCALSLNKLICDSSLENKLSILNKLDKKNNIMCITIPKSGTHLLTKCVTLLELDNVNFPYNNRDDHYKVLDNLINCKEKLKPITLEKYCRDELEGLVSIMIKRDKKAFQTHIPYSLENENFINEYTKKGFLNIRDPRDQLVSSCKRIYTILPKALNISLDKILLDAIIGQQKAGIPIAIPTPEYRAMCSIGIIKYYESYIKWQKNSKICIVKFENLVGSAGGGSDLLQFNEIKLITKHLGLKLTDQQILNIAKNLFGNTTTFSEGKIGSWKKYFNKQHIEAFKKSPGANELLIRLGYEKNSNW